MKNKKGFTLIELLAVIVILAIIALIATPIILNMIDSAKKGAAKDSAYGYIEAIDFQNSMSGIDNEKYKMVGPGEDLDVTGLDVKVKGSKPESGTVTIDKSGRVTKAELCINNYIVTYDGKTATTGSKCGETEKEEVTGPTSENPDTTKTKGLIKIVYLDPTDLTKTCTKEDAEKNLNEKGTPTGIKTGCMKWYAYKDDGTNYTMILDHNTTPLVAWNSTKSNAEMKEVTDSLTNDTNGWKGSPRLITANEVAEIIGAKDSLKWDSSKTYGTDDIETKVSWVYFDGTGTTYSSTDGWQKQVATSQGASKYVWLYDNTYGCTNNGCNISDDNKYEYGTTESTNYMYGYWTSTSVVGYSNSAWNVNRDGYLNDSNVVNFNIYGVRPVITINKLIIN